MAAPKENLCVVLDVGPTMRESGGIQAGVEAIRQLLLQKMLYAKKDDVAIILFGTEETQNPLADSAEGQYEYVYLLRPIGHTESMLVSIRQLDALAAKAGPAEDSNGSSSNSSSKAALSGRSVAGDPLDAVVLGVSLLSNAAVSTGRGKAAARRLWVVTDGLSSMADTEQMGAIGDEMTRQGIRMDLIEVDFAATAERHQPRGNSSSISRSSGGDVSGGASDCVAPSGRATHFTLSKQQAVAQQTTLGPLRDLAGSSGGGVASCADTMTVLAQLRSRSIGQVTKFRGDLAIGSTVKIPVWAYSHTAEQKAPSLGRATKDLLDAQGRPKTAAGGAGGGGGGGGAEEGGDDEDGGGAAPGFEPAGMGRPGEVKFERVYRPVLPAAAPAAAPAGDEDGSGEGAAADGPAAEAPAVLGEELGPEQRGKMYKYGSELVPVGPTEEVVLKWEHERELTVIGFTPVDGIPRYMVMGSVDVIVPSQDPKGDPAAASAALSALARAMAAEKTVAIARYIKRKGSAPLWGMLVPALAVEEEAGGSGSSGTDVSQGDEDPMAPSAPSASSQRSHSTSTAVAAKKSSASSSSSAPLSGYAVQSPLGRDVLYFCPLPFEDDLRKFKFHDFSQEPKFAPSAEQLAAVDKLIDALDLMHAPADPEHRSTWEALQPENTFNPQLARFYAAVAARALDNRIEAGVAPLPAAVAEYLYPDALLQAAAEKAIAGFRAAVGPGLKRGRGKGDDILEGRRLYNEKREEEAATAAAAGASSFVPSKRHRGEEEEMEGEAAGKKLTAGLFGAGGGGGSSSADVIGTANPVGDFQAMLTRPDRDMTDAAMAGMSRVIRQLACDALGHSKGIDALRAMREGALNNYSDAKYNALLRELLGQVTASSSTGALRAFLARAVLDEGLGLLTRDDSSNVVDVTQADGAAFAQAVRQATGASGSLGVAAPVTAEGAAAAEDWDVDFS